MSKMTSSELELHILSQLILEYRASLETMSKIFNLNQNEVYAKVMQIDSDLVKSALIYVLDYETTENGIVDQNEAKRKIRMFLINLHHAKDGKEKLKVIKALDNNDQINAIKRKKGKDLTPEEIDAVINYRYKYAISRMAIQDKLNVSRHILERREKNLDENFQKRLLKLNEYNAALRFMPKKGYR